MRRKIFYSFLLIVSLFAFVFVIASCDNNSNNNSNNLSTNSNTSSNSDNPVDSGTTDDSSITTDDNAYYTITFKDYDGTILQTSSVKKGDMPTYNKSNPVRSSDEEYSYTFRGWNPSLSEVEADAIYTATYKRNSAPYKRIENKIYFGTYPQTKVTDDTLISELNTLAGTKPTSTNSYNWKVYDYYISSILINYMFYQDIDYDNDGEYDYRGVYFTQYRPGSFYQQSTISYCYQNQNGYLINEIYWFSYDPIEWNILAESDGKALIIANHIIDAQNYYPENGEMRFNHNGGNGYASNYELSYIRKFINDDLYNVAFNESQEKYIKTTIVDNSRESSLFDRKFNDEFEYKSAEIAICNNTIDKMFLLSCRETQTYLSENTNAKGTDYAKCQGLRIWNSDGNGNSLWWLRTPDDENDAYSVASTVYFESIYVGFIEGVRPACWITLED